MQIHVKYRVHDNTPTGPMYSVRVKVTHSADDVPRYVPDAIACQTIELLAQRWFLINSAGEANDGNAVLCGSDKQVLASTTLKSLENYLTLTSGDPIALAATVMRIKRACAFAAEAVQYDALFEWQHEDVTQARAAAGTSPLGKSGCLPPVPDKIADYLAKQ